MAGRSSLRLGDAGGLTQFGANEVILSPGAKSSLRHWHHREDEFVMVTAGECVLVQDEGETLMRPGDCAAFPAGDPNGHHFISTRPLPRQARTSRHDAEKATYSDVDLEVELKDGKATFTHKDGTPYQGDRT
ncbi:MAG: cupin domain-containing protein [Paracoccaceae bacterium]